MLLEADAVAPQCAGHVQRVASGEAAAAVEATKAVGVSLMLVDAL